MAEWDQLSFWADEHQRHFETLAPWVIEILFRGAVGGVDLLPEGLRVLMDWNTFNQAALDWLQQWQLGELAQIDEYTRSRAVQVISEWVKSGEPLPLLAKRLGTFIDNPARAKRIAVTEVTRMFAEGNILAWQNAGTVSGKRWMTARDERVCPICGPLHNQIVSLGDGWTVEGGQVVGGLGLMSPPAHPNCRCYLQPIVDLDMARGKLERILGARP